MISKVLTALLFIGCAEEGSEIGPTLDVPGQVHVDQLGPVTVPMAVLADGSTASVIWTVDNPEVAEVRGKELLAVGPGRTRIHGTHDAEELAWTLVVEPTITLLFHKPPMHVGVGETADLRLHGRVGSVHVTPAEVLWTSSDTSVVMIEEDGRVSGVEPGVAYITARSGGSSAMLELKVIE